jgi:hypothetical protein
MLSAFAQRGTSALQHFRPSARTVGCGVAAVNELARVLDRLAFAADAAVRQGPSTRRLGFLPDLRHRTPRVTEDRRA